MAERTLDWLNRPRLPERSVTPVCACAALCPFPPNAPAVSVGPARGILWRVANPMEPPQLRR
jgi:hypothetical protein